MNDFKHLESPPPEQLHQLDYLTPGKVATPPKSPREKMDRRALVRFVFGLVVGAGVSAVLWSNSKLLGNNEFAVLGMFAFVAMKPIVGTIFFEVRGWKSFGIGILVSIPLVLLIGIGIGLSQCGPITSR